MTQIRSSTWWRVGAGLAVAAVVAAAVWLIALDRGVVNGFEAHLHRQPAVVYASRLTIRPGDAVDPDTIAHRLERLGFRAAEPVSSNSDDPLGPGQYRWTEPELLEVALRSSDALLPSEEAASSSGQVVTLTVRDRQFTAVRAPDQSLAAALLVGAEPLGVIAGEHRLSMRPVRLAEMPPVLLSAILTTEDRRFWDHSGVDLRALARAALADLRAGRIVEGGSTLTQQLVKNLFLGHEQTLRRKAKEAVMALLLEAHYSKETIVEAYLNSIYFGPRTGAVGEGTQAVIGIGEAAEFYFGRPVTRLSVAEQALLAAMIKSPARYAPGGAPSLDHGNRGNHGDYAKARRDLVLRRLTEAGVITPAMGRAASAEPITTAAPAALMQGSAPYVVDWVNQLLQERAVADGRLTAAPPGARIVTTIDPALQQAAEVAVRDGLAQLDQLTAARRSERAERAGKAVPPEPLQAALVAIDPHTGAIKALVGGRDYRKSQFNRVVQARRQPGSLFKPVVYLAALERSEAGPPPFTLASIISDEPITLEAGGKSWTPKNVDLTYRGLVTFRQVAESSLNAATVQIATAVGFDRIVEVARATGASGDRTLPALPSIALGAVEASPLEMATVYATLAHGGERIEPSVLDLVIEPDRGEPNRREPDRGTATPWSASSTTPAVSPAAAYLVTSLLAGVIDHGTGRMVRVLGFDRPAAGKTGTSSGLRDAWFAGYTPELAVLVWVGYDQPQSIGLTGAQAALPIWTQFMQQALEGEAISTFAPPDGVVSRRIDPTSGTLASWKCADGVPEWFIAGTEPADRCSGNSVAGIIRGWVGRVQQWFAGPSGP